MTIFDHHTLKGALSINYDFNIRITLIKQLAIKGLTDNIYIYNNKGEVIFSANPSQPLKNFIAYNSRSLLKSFPLKPGYHSQKINGNIFVASDISGIHSGILLVTSKQTIQKYLNLFFRPMLLISVSSFILIILMSLFTLWIIVKEFKSKEKYISNLLYLMQNMLVIVDKKSMIITRTNIAIEKKLRYEPNELIGQSIRTLLPSEDMFQQVNSEIALNHGIKNIEFSYIAKSGETTPVLFSTSTFGDSLICVAQDITEQKRTEAQLDFMARHDPLTKLANRKALDSFFAHEIPRAERHQLKFAVLATDLDKFKPVNDTFGHEVGDKILKEISKRFMNVVRQEDFICRTGGDEFLIIITQLANEADAVSIAQKIIQTINKPYKIDNHDIETGISIGIACFPTDGNNKKDLLINADKAMYVAKKEKGNTCVLYSTLKHK